MITIGSRNGFTIRSNFGTVIQEGTLNGRSQGTGAPITFSFHQATSIYNTGFVEIVPISGETTDFWDNFWSNKVGGEPADSFALSTFVSLNGGTFLVNLNADAFVEQDEVFEVRLYESHMDRFWGVPALATARFTIRDDDRFVKGTTGNDNLLGTIYSEKILGFGGNDKLEGLAGNDHLDGGIGADTMEGGAGNDIYIVDNIGDRVIEAGNGGTDAVHSTITYNLAASVENLVLTGSAAINGTGNLLANRLTGNGAANQLVGGLGADSLFGNGGNDTLLGGTEADLLDGGAGIDLLQGGAGNDTYVVDNPGDRVAEAGSGIDLVRAGVSFQLPGLVENLILTGNAAINGTGNALANSLTGNAAANLLFGGAGADILNGGAGQDTINGGLGTDQLAGGPDAIRDVFIFNALSESAVGTGRDRIGDFRTGIDDIDLRALDADTRVAGNQAFDFSGTTATANAVWYIKAGANLVVRADVTGDRVADFEIAVLNQTGLSAGDFLL